MPRPLAAALLLLSSCTAACTAAEAETLLIGNKGENTVSFVDLASGKERVRLPTGVQPHEIAVSPDGRQVAVVAYGGTTIDLFDVRQARLIRRIDLAPNGFPHGIVWLKNGKLAIAAERSASLVIVDPSGQGMRSVPTGQQRTHMLAVSPDQRLAYLTNVSSGTISVIGLKEGRKLKDFSVGGNPEGIAVTNDGKQLWVGDNTTPRVRVIDAASGAQIAEMPTDPIAIRVAISPDGKTAVTSNMVSGTLSVFDVASRRSLRTIKVSGERAALQVTIAFSRDGRRLFVAETGRDKIAEVDMASGAVLRRIDAGRYGDGLAVAP